MAAQERATHCQSAPFESHCKRIPLWGQRMDAIRKKKVFISYSWKDKPIAEQVRRSIPNEFDVWIDEEQIKPGDSVSKVIVQGLDSSDYYIIIISENSNTSQWVQKEIATAFELSNKKKLSVVPLLLQGAEVPFEFKGLLYIDFRSSIDVGLQHLREFFLKQAAPIDFIEPSHKVLKSEDMATQRRRICSESLRKLSLGDLRHLASERLSLEQVEVVWFDIFGLRMRDEVKVENLALSCVELIDRSRRTGVLANLIDILCRNYPFINSPGK